MGRKKGVDTLSVGFEALLRPRRQRGKAAFRFAVEAERANELVDRQKIGAPASVFGYDSPYYRVPSNPALFGPEFQIYTPTESVLLGNEMHQLIHNPGGDPSIDFAPFQAAAATGIDALLDLINKQLFYGRMSTELRAALYKAVQPSYDAEQRARTALYLSTLSGHYAVQF